MIIFTPYEIMHINPRAINNKKKRYTSIAKTKTSSLYTNQSTPHQEPNLVNLKLIYYSQASLVSKLVKHIANA